MTHPVIHHPQAKIAPKKNKSALAWATAEREGLASWGARSDHAGAFPCAPLENLCAPLSRSASSPAPRYIPGPGQAPTRPGSASSPPLLSMQGSSPWRQPSSQQARNGKRRVRALCKGAGDEPGTSGDAGRVTRGTCADEPGRPVALPLPFKMACQGTVW